MIPGETRTGPGELILNSTLSTILISVVNDGDRPIQVGSHLHFPDANPALSFDRSAAEGFRLDIPSGTSLRFEPGVGVDVPLVALGGRRRPRHPRAHRAAGASRGRHRRGRAHGPPDTRGTRRGADGAGPVHPSPADGGNLTWPG